MSTSTSKAADLSGASQSSASIVKAGRFNMVFLVIFTVIAAVAVALAISWMQERPIRQAEQLLEEGLRSQTLAIAEGREPDDSMLRDAYHSISQFLESKPDSTRGLALQARILFHIGRPEEAIEIFEAVGADSNEEIQDFARCFVALEQYSRAIPLIELVLEKDPNYSDALYEASTCRAKLGRFKEALDTAQRFTAQPGNEAKGHLLVASIQTDMSNRAGAIESFEKVLEYEPEGERLGIPAWQFFYLFGGILAEDSRPEEALPYLEKSLGLVAHADTYTKIGECHLALAEPQKAEAAWRMAVKQNPSHPVALEQLATYELSKGNAQDALKWLQPLQGQVASSTVAYAFQRAYALDGQMEESEKWRELTEQLRQGETVVGAINQVLQNEPESMWGIALRAHRFGRYGKWDQAEDLVSSLRVDDQSHPFLKELATAVQQKRMEELPSFDLLPIDLK